MNSICLTSAIENRDRSDKEQLEQYILDIAAGNQQALAADRKSVV